MSARARAANLGRIYLAQRQGSQAIPANSRSGIRYRSPGGEQGSVGAAKGGDNHDERAKAERTLRQALHPPRLRLLTQLNALPEGFHFLVDLRAELLSWRKDDPALAALERDLLSLLVSWFDVGFLELRRISWESPAALLEKSDRLRGSASDQELGRPENRLSTDRRCFAFFHPRMPNEPLIIVQVALVHGIADNVQTLLDESAPVLDPTEADTAIFTPFPTPMKG